MGDALDITVSRERDVVIAAVTGDVDISTVAQLRECLFELADGGGTLIVDLNRVTFIDSAGLGALIGAARRAVAHGGSGSDPLSSTVPPLSRPRGANPAQCARLRRAHYPGTAPTPAR